jgi:DNA-binding Lrp family transcriptional regulator
MDKLRLLFALQENPVAPAAALAKQIGVTSPTARAWLKDLRKNQVYGGVHANLRSRRIGLELDDFILKVDSFKSLEKIEEFCNLHPYTSYRARIFGGNEQGIMLQFRQPDEARQHLLDALDVMKTEGLVRDIREIPTLSTQYGSRYTRPKFDAWDDEKMSWSFDWNRWWDKKPKKTQKDQNSTIDNQPLILDKLDVQLLQEVTMNARRKNTEIIEAMGYAKNEPGIQQKVSTKLKMLEMEVIEEYRVFINWTHFDVYNTPFIIAQADDSVTNQLVSRLSEGDFPFGSNIRKTRNGFVWSARLPSNHVSELMALVWKVSERFEVLMLDYKHSQIYGLWADVFDSASAKWKTSRAFCFTDPLKGIGLL